MGNYLLDDSVHCRGDSQFPELPLFLFEYFYPADWKRLVFAVPNLLTDLHSVLSKVR